MSGDAFVPRGVLASPDTVRWRVAAMAGVGVGAMALAGMWLRIEDGLLMRAVLGTTSAAFAAVVTNVALKAGDARFAFGRALGLAIIFGFLDTIIPSMILCSHDSIPFAACLVFGAFAGGFFGFLYGILLGILASVALPHVAARTHEGADLAMRRAAGWTLLPVLLAGAVAFLYDGSRDLTEWPWISEADRMARIVALPIGAFGVAVALSVAAVAWSRARTRMRERGAWVAAISRGDDPSWTLRELGPHDDVASLTPIGRGSSVLAYVGDEAAYRRHASGRAIARL